MREQARLYVAGDGYLRLIPASGRTYPELKEQLGATWDDQPGGWKFPRLRTNVLQVIEALGQDAVDMDEETMAIGDGPGFPLVEVEHPRMPDLLPFQREAVTYLVSNPHGSLLNVSPGLGKTVISIVAAEAFSVSPTADVLVVAPASLLPNWWREIEKWAPGWGIEIADKDGGFYTGHQFTIASYDTVAQNTEAFTKRHWDLLILDETVLVKNRSSQRYLAIAGGTKESTRKGKKVTLRWKGLIRSADKVWALSGSPVTRYADDLWTQLHLLYPKGFNSFWRFADRFCVFTDNIWSKTGKEIAGTRESRDLTWELGDVMLTITQEDVLPDLPEYIIEPTIEVELLPAQKKAFRSMLQDFIIELDSGREMDAENKLSQLIRLQQVVAGMANIPDAGVASAKADALLELIEARAYAFPMLVWTHWKGSSRDLTHRLTSQSVNAAWVSGEDTPKARDHKIEAYKAGDTDVLVLSLGVGKFGHTLINSRTVVRYDKTWAADDFIQSMRRARRIGLTHRPVLVTLNAPGTSDDLLEANLAGKMPSIAKVTNSQLKELLEGLGL